MDFDHEQLVELARLAGFSELVYLGTCNRVEFYFVAARDANPFELVADFYRRFNGLKLPSIVIKRLDGGYETVKTFSYQEFKRNFG